MTEIAGIFLFTWVIKARRLGKKNKNGLARDVVRCFAYSFFIVAATNKMLRKPHLSVLLKLDIHITSVCVVKI